MNSDRSLHHLKAARVAITRRGASIRRAASRLLFLLVLLACRPSHAQLLYADSFQYPDGPIIGAPGSPWINNYPPANQANVIAGQLFLTQTEDESVRVDFPYVNSGQLYARFRVTFTTLPTGEGNYFAFFRQSGVDNNRARIWATTNGAAAGKFQLGVRNAGGAPLFTVPADLSLHTAYTVLLRYNVTNHTCTLWIDPVTEADVVRRVDTGTNNIAIGIRHFAFLQTDTYNNGQGMGELFVDDLRIATSFAAAMEVPRISSLARASNGHVSLAGVSFPTTDYVVLACTDLAAPTWEALHTNTAAADGTFSFTDITATGQPQRFYRLQSQ